MKSSWLSIIFITLFSAPAYADFVFTVSNSMLNQVNPSAGEVAVYNIDPFNPNDHCSTFIAPNSCEVNGSNIEWSLVFDYEVTTTAGESLDVSFGEQNGLGGTMGSFILNTTPTPLFGLENGMSGTFEYNVSFPYFSPDLSFGLLIEMDITVNP